MPLSGRGRAEGHSNHSKRSAAAVQCREPMQSRRRSARIGGGSLPQEDCMGYATILGMDLGKFKSVCCVMDAASGEHGFETLDTNPAAVKALLVKHASADRSVLLVVEACDAAG